MKNNGGRGKYTPTDICIQTCCNTHQYRPRSIKILIKKKINKNFFFANKVQNKNFFVKLFFLLYIFFIFFFNNSPQRVKKLNELKMCLKICYRKGGEKKNFFLFFFLIFFFIFFFFFYL